MKNIFMRLTVMAFSAILILAAGCSATRPAKFYTLSSIKAPEAESRKQAITEDVAVGIGPVRFPDYLNRPQVVTRNSRNALKFSEFHRWGGSLKDDFSAVLAENLSILLSSNRISLFPWKKATPIDYRITADVIHFEGEIDGSVVLKVRWVILDGTEKRVILMKKSTFSVVVEGNGYEALASAQSRALEDFSREIAGSIHAIKNGFKT
ncbi:MAG: membrane integrity-associated transporter subunit PqiC [Deltaproteobacteria bacterium]|nr:membrane integrity-associated transporter subunit PqiC [Deltaproteobacteria bacterium]